jgi:hypothetical protein
MAVRRFQKFRLAVLHVRLKNGRESTEIDR